VGQLPLYVFSTLQTEIQTEIQTHCASFDYSNYCTLTNLIKLPMFRLLHHRQTNHPCTIRTTARVMVEVESMATQGAISRPGAWSFPDCLVLGVPGESTYSECSN
jgi:hypothetical protein